MLGATHIPRDKYTYRHKEKYWGKYTEVFIKMVHRLWLTFILGIFSIVTTSQLVHIALISEKIQYYA